MQTFREAYEGWLSGLLQWQDVDRLLAVITAAPEGWYVYDTRAALPQAPELPAALPARLDEIMAFLRRHHRADYCGFLYVDDKAAPTLVKVYDPRNASSCSLGAPLPVYTLSRMPPEPLPLAAIPDPATTSEQGGIVSRWFKG